MMQLKLIGLRDYLSFLGGIFSFQKKTDQVLEEGVVHLE